ncbi:MAG: FAD-binding oxidoreductase [Gemmatimonadaceae bacterium]
MPQTRDSNTVAPIALPVDADAILAPDAWGFSDTQFTILPNGNVSLGGTRYALSGLELPDLVPWVQGVMGVTFNTAALDNGHYPPPVPAARTNDAFVNALRQRLPAAALSSAPLVRLRHGHGHTVEEIYAVRNGGLSRVPDLVVYPESEEHVTTIVQLAARHDVSLVAFGGGTNVTDALRCAADEERMIVSVDTRRMNRILWIDTVNRTACIEAGAIGRHITDALAKHGFTMGHEPDSYEFSTLGGWIATHASGMKKNRYGNIEDLVLDVRIVTEAGIVSRTPVVPRESIGADPRRWIYGSEGQLGIVTQAVVKLRPVPETEQHDAILFPSFETGVEFLHELSREGSVPASVRLVDNLQFQLSQTLKPKATGAATWKRKLEKWIVTRVKGLDPQQMVACTLLFEGERREVAQQRAAVNRLSRKYGGMHAGAENGRKGYQLTFGIAYLRDFVMKLGVVAESFETSVAWSDTVTLCDRVKQRLYDEYARTGLPGRPFVTARVTQLYGSGVCVYFYFGFFHGGSARPIETFGILERAARDEILKSGGSLSHHHGVGQLRKEFLPRVLSPAALTWQRAVKAAVDPRNLFGAGKA